MPDSLASELRTKGRTHMPKGHIIVMNAEAYQDYIVGNTPIITPMVASQLYAALRRGNPKVVSIAAM
jgi:hypothetical protein